MRSVVCFVTNEEQKKDAIDCSQGQPDVLDAKTFGDLAEQSVDGESNDQEEIQVDEGERVAVCNAGVSGEFAQTQPQSAVFSNSPRWAYVTESLEGRK